MFQGVNKAPSEYINHQRHSQQTFTNPTKTPQMFRVRVHMLGLDNVQAQTHKAP